MVARTFGPGLFVWQGTESLACPQPYCSGAVPVKPEPGVPMI
jgi:hypothetical protein